VGPLAAAIAAGGDGPAAARVLEVAARIASPALAAPAAARAGDPDPVVRAWVARLLGALGGADHVAAVTALLDDPARARALAAAGRRRAEEWPDEKEAARRVLTVYAELTSPRPPPAR
jgi:HEAT repeat protein